MPDFDADVIVIGSGAGGGTFAYACAREGKRVLVVERGRRPESGAGRDERRTLLEKEPYDDRAFLVNGAPRRLFVGGVLGGGTALYGAALLRPSREDFHPERHYRGRIPPALASWPIDYDDLAPHYAEAERLYGLAREAGADLSPLEGPAAGAPAALPPPHPANRRLMRRNRRRGLKPFLLPLGIDFGRCLRCAECAGYVCPNGARRSAAALLEEPGPRDPPRVLVSTEAEAFLLDGRGRVEGLRLLDRASGRRSVLRARRYALAAGAIGSPALLLRSGISSPSIGAHYMCHLCPVVGGVFLAPTGAEEAFVKQVGFADYYLGAPAYGHKMGMIQSLPVPGPLTLAKMAAGLPRALAGFVRRRLLFLFGIIEDLPDPQNRVTLDAAGGIAVRHRFAPYDLERGARLGRLMGRILRAAGAVFCVGAPLPSEEHVAHQCGTLRFGRDPAHAVLDPECRMFAQPDVFVVDGSFFPTSLGVGPALTIMANALRVARIVAREA
jgi:choline dehydrogenase-like flavoprotein